MLALTTAPDGKEILAPTVEISPMEQRTTTQEGEETINVSKESRSVADVASVVDPAQFDADGFFVWTGGKPQGATSTCNRTDVASSTAMPTLPASLLDANAVKALHSRLRAVLEGTYDTGKPPTKSPKKHLVRDALHPSAKQQQKVAAAAKKEQGTSRPASKGNDNNDSSGSSEEEKGESTSTPAAAATTAATSPNSTLQVINIRYCDSLFEQLVHSPVLGAIVAEATGWTHGCRVAQDQVWVKPPQCGPLTFHRDSPYFDFSPSDVCTVWITLDDLTQPDAGLLGPLQYCPGSHKWSEARSGSANQFFSGNYKALLESAASREGVALDADGSVPLVTVTAPAGGFSVHNGRTWHGSGPNRSSTKFRCGLGIHYIPGNATFDLSQGNANGESSGVGKLWKPYYEAALAAMVAKNAEESEQKEVGKGTVQQKEKEKEEERSDRLHAHASGNNSSTVPSSVPVPDDLFPLVGRGSGVPYSNKNRLL